jgi:hypothetical protein
MDINILKRYNIIDENTLKRRVTKLQAYLREQKPTTGPLPSARLVDGGETGSILLGPERRYLCTDRVDGSTGPRIIASRQRGRNR